MVSKLSHGAATVSLALAGAAGASDGIQPGLWKVTSTPEIAGAAAPAQVKTRCLTREESSDVDTTFSPAHHTQNSTCERVEHEVTGTRLIWRLQCTGQMSMDVAGTFDFDTPRHYTAVVSTSSAIGGQKMSSRVSIEGEWIGECQ
jgi:hypothetical protein